jgi:cell division protein FtsA
MPRDDYFVGIDVGTDKIVCLIGKRGEIEDINIVGMGKAPSRGVKAGSIVDLDAVSEDIMIAINEAEMMASVKVEEAIVSISGAQIKSVNSSGTITVSGKEKITENEIEKVLQQTREFSMPKDRDILHLVPQEYKLDSQEGIVNPIGMSGHKLDGKVHIITALKASINNLMTCVNKAGVEVKGIVPSFIAAAETILNHDERELGVGLVDIGKGTTDMAFYENGSIWNSFVIPVGGYYFTSDIAIGLMTSIGEAEKIKRKDGTVIVPENSANRTITFSTSKGDKEKTIPIDILVDILNPRAKEILGIIKDSLKQQNVFDRMNSGIVLTGGTANLQGFTEVAEEVFGIPARIGKPGKNIEGLAERVSHPEYSVAVGLLFLAAREESGKRGFKKKGILGILKGLIDRF